MVYEDLIRSALRMSWHHTPHQVTRLPGGVMSITWAVGTDAGDSGAGQFVAKLVDPADRGCLEAGLAAAEQLRARGIAAGEPQRTLAGSLTADTDLGPLALIRVPSGRPLNGGDPLDQQWWGDRLGAAHRALDGFQHTGLLRWPWLRTDAPHLGVQPWLRPAVAAAAAAMTRLTVTDRLTFGVLHGDPAPGEFRVDPATGRTGLLGWGRAATGPLVYDLAAALTYADGPDPAKDLVDGYTAAGAVAHDEVEAALPVLLRYRWAVQADWLARRLAGVAGTGVPEAGSAGAGAGLRGVAGPAEIESGLRRARAALAAASG